MNHSRQAPANAAMLCPDGIELAWITGRPISTT
jgi:hypothetical protein